MRRKLEKHGTRNVHESGENVIFAIHQHIHRVLVGAVADKIDAIAADDEDLGDERELELAGLRSHLVNLQRCLRIRLRKEHQEQRSHDASAADISLRSRALEANADPVATGCIHGAHMVRSQKPKRCL